MLSLPIEYVKQELLKRKYELDSMGDITLTEFPIRRNYDDEIKYVSFDIGPLKFELIEDNIVGK